MDKQRIHSFAEFWPFYLGEHSSRLNRWLHFVGTNLAIAFFAAGLWIDPRLLWFVPVAGYGFAWVGHFVVEKNRPATFRYPLWSLMADFKMWALMWVGRLGRAIERRDAAAPAKVLS